MSRRRELAEPPGQDSFLDVVANLVGILIILVVVIGAHAGATWTDQKTSAAEEEALQQLQVEAEQATQEAGSRERHNREVEARIRQEEAIAKLRDTERDEWLRRIKIVELALQDELAKRSEHQQQAFDLAGAISDAQVRLTSLRRERESIEALDTGPMKLDHLPTPIAKTVFTNEVHFRLKKNRLAYVPLNELVDQMRNEWRVKADNLKFTPETTETVGPVDGFRMQYQLRLSKQVVQTEFGTMQRETPEFAGFVMLPSSDELGTDIDTALSPNSWFEQKLRRLDPQETTVTVWVYPDSYAEFSTLKRWLYERGFLTAGWPLPDGYPIAGGPDGQRSGAQ